MTTESKVYRQRDSNKLSASTVHGRTCIPMTCQQVVLTVSVDVADGLSHAAETFLSIITSAKWEAFVMNSV